MFRQGARRFARHATFVASAPALLRPRAIVPTFRQEVAHISRPSMLSKHLFSSIRLYSSEAAAVEEPAASETEVVSFKDLQKLGVHENLISPITQRMRYELMTPVQAKTITPALRGTDIVAQAKTGTGKTMAFLLPLLQRMINEDPSLASRGASRRARCDDIRGIVLSPTRELAEQIAHEARRLVVDTGLVVQAAVGGTSKNAMLAQTQRQGCHLLIATPGRLHDVLSDDSSGIAAPNLAALVLDEADRMLDAGFENELHAILNMLPDPATKVRQTMLVSATIPDEVIGLARKMVRNDDFEFVQTISPTDSLTHDKVNQHVVAVSSWANMFPTLFELLDKETKAANENPEHPFKAIIYLNTTAMTELAGELSMQMRRKLGMHTPVYTINSRLTQGQRTRASETFRKARSGVLISSDVTARGMDFPNVTHVIQIDVPINRETYIHRLGRTGRQDKNGEGWLLLPNLSVAPAKRLLKGLPLKQNETLESATADVANQEATEYHEHVKEMAKTIPKNVIATAYKSLFGFFKGNKNDLAEDLHSWSTDGMGLPDAPQVPSSWARNMGLNNAKMNIGSGGMSSRDGGDRGSWGNDRYERNDRFGSRDGGRGGYRGNRDFGGSRRNDEDPFNAMRHQVRRDAPPRGRY